MQYNNPILLGETEKTEVQRLAEELRRKGYLVRSTYCPGAFLRLMRRHLFTRAVVAVEMEVDHRPLLDRLAALPGIERIVAIGPADSEAEREALANGADVYLARRVDCERLMMALGKPMQDAVGTGRDRTAWAYFGSTRAALAPDNE